MKKQILTMFTGLFIGAIITGGASAYAAGILAERSNHRIFVDGQEVQMEAYHDAVDAAPDFRAGRFQHRNRDQAYQQHKLLDNAASP